MTSLRRRHMPSRRTCCAPVASGFCIRHTVKTTALWTADLCDVSRARVLGQLETLRVAAPSRGKRIGSYAFLFSALCSCGVPDISFFCLTTRRCWITQMNQDGYLTNHTSHRVVHLTLPPFVFTYPRPRQYHPALGVASQECIEGSLHSTLAPSIFPSLATTS